ncbi:hypothetical protein D3C81_941200 [compost metagenome]
MPLLGTHAMEGGVAGDAGVVDQDFHRAQCGFDRFDQGAAAGRISDIAGEHRNVIALCLHLLLPVLRLLRIAEVGGDTMALVGQALADGGTNAAGTTGDQCDAGCHGQLLQGDCAGESPILKKLRSGRGRSRDDP